MRMFSPLIFVFLFIGWVLYRTFITRDLREHRNDLYMGGFFIGIWGLLYAFLWFA